MSSLTPCNYCNLRDMRRRAKEVGARIVLRPYSGIGGPSVYQVPKGKKLAPEKDMIHACDEYPNGNKAHSEYWAASFGGLSESCCC